MCGVSDLRKDFFIPNIIDAVFLFNNGVVIFGLTILFSLVARQDQRNKSAQ